MKSTFGIVTLSLLAGLGHTASLGRLPDQQILAAHPGDGDQSVTEGTGGVREELKRAKIIPTVIDDFVPILNLEAKWSDDNQASLGNTLKPTDLQDKPSILLRDPLSSTADCRLRSSTSIVIVITDPDAPSRDDPKWSEFCHWIAVGGPVTEDYPITDEQTETQGCPLSLSHRSLEDVMSYTPPAPPEKTGKHRYVILALAPINGTSEKLHLSQPKERKRWGHDELVDDKTHGVRDWAAENGLSPLAANFIFAQNEKQ